MAYFNYLDSTVQWSTQISAGGQGFTYYELDHYFVNGDTLLDGIWYWNIYRNGYNSYNNVESPIPTTPWMGLREDSSRKFYIYNYQQTGAQDELWYDFNYQLGDTLIPGSIYLVDEIDTIQFGAEQHLFWKSIFPAGIIEGMGLAWNGAWNPYLVCFKKDTALYSVGSCNFDVAVNEVQNNPTQVLVYPNPATNEIHLQLQPNNGNRIQDLKIYDSAGREMHRQQKFSGTLVKVDVSMFSNGVYFFEFTSSNQEIVRGKFSVIR